MLTPSMLAATYEPGSTELHVREVPAPEPGSGEVRVRLAVSGVNPTDWKTRKRTPPPAETFLIPNQDGAGTIDAVGAGVSPDRVGERVWVLLGGRNDGWGTAAQYTVVPDHRAIPLPAEASFELGASLGVPALTASYCLNSDGPVAGRSVLVAGGAGAVGHAAIELARFEDAARVIATVSGPEKAELARAAGAHTVNYRDPDAADQIRAAAPDGIDRFIEVALHQNLELDLAVAAQYGVIVSYAADDSSVAQVPVRRLMVMDLTLRFMLLYTVAPQQLAAAVGRTRAALAAGALTTLPLHRFTLDQIEQAHDAVEQGAVGKVVIDLP